MPILSLPLGASLVTFWAHPESNPPRGADPPAARRRNPPQKEVLPWPGRSIDRIYLREPVPADSYLSALPAVRALGDREHPLLFPAGVTFLVGENGTGKSTLLEAVAVACGFNAEGGTRNFDFSTRATHSPLHEYLTVGRTAYPRDGFFLRAESFYNVATNIDEMDEAPSFGPRLIDSYGGVSLHDQSHGESFLALVEHRGRVSSLWWSTASGAMASTSWTSRRPHSPPPG